MYITNTFYVKRNGIYIWLGENIEPLETDEIIEKRPLIVADKGKVISKDGEILGPSWWEPSGKMDGYTEVDDEIPEEEPPESPEPVIDIEE